MHHAFLAFSLKFQSPVTKSQPKPKPGVLICLWIPSRSSLLWEAGKGPDDFLLKLFLPPVICHFIWQCYDTSLAFIGLKSHKSHTCTPLCDFSWGEVNKISIHPTQGTEDTPDRVLKMHQRNYSMWVSLNQLVYWSCLWNICEG